MPNLPEPAKQFQEFIKARARTLREHDQSPASQEAWLTQKAGLRAKLLESWGGFPTEHCPLEPKILGELKRPGYRVEKIIFQTRPGIWMTANAYIPDGENKRAAVLCVHGHWKGAKQDPVPQARCIGLAKLGFFVLAVDAFGAGERGIEKTLGQYHGEMTGATLWPAGLPLSGIQVYENMRAVDYLQSRPEVDGTRLGITGASGGGNQSMYAGAFDERFGCVVPTCSVGRLQSYLSAACCLCEVVPDILSYTEEAAVLGLVAPRALMVISATRDAFQFSVGEAEQSLAGARKIFQLFDVDAKLKHAVFESGHDYNREMRESMYGWMTLHLKGEGQGMPIAEPEMQIEDPETLRCWPGNTRPDDYVTLPRFAARESQKLVEAHNARAHLHAEHWEATAAMLKHTLSRRVLGGFPPKSPLTTSVVDPSAPGVKTYLVETEPGIQVAVEHHAAKPAVGNEPAKKLAIILNLEGTTATSEVGMALESAGWDRVLVDLRATGRFSVAGDKIGSANDHNSGEWSVLTGRPLLGQWIWDVRRVLDLLVEREPQLAKGATLVGVGAAGIVALGAAASDTRFSSVALWNSPATLVADAPYGFLRLGVAAPRLLRDVGDVAQLAALVAPRRLVIGGSHSPGGAVVPPDAQSKAFLAAQRVYALLKAEERLKFAATAGEVVGVL